MPGEIVGSGRAVAPLAAAVLATVSATVLPAGLYDITVHASVQGVAAIDVGNMKLVRNGADFANPIPHGTNSADSSTTYSREQLDGINPVSVVVVGNATAGVVYTASIEINPVG